MEADKTRRLREAQRMAFLQQEAEGDERKAMWAEEARQREAERAEEARQREAAREPKRPSGGKSRKSSRAHIRGLSFSR